MTITTDNAESLAMRYTISDPCVGRTSLLCYCTCRMARDVPPDLVNWVCTGSIRTGMQCYCINLQVYFQGY